MDQNREINRTFACNFLNFFYHEKKNFSEITVSGLPPCGSSEAVIVVIILTIAQEERPNW